MAYIPANANNVNTNIGVKRTCGVELAAGMDDNLALAHALMRLEKALISDTQARQARRQTSHEERVERMVTRDCGVQGNESGDTALASHFAQFVRDVVALKKSNAFGGRDLFTEDDSATKMDGTQEKDGWKEMANLAADEGRLLDAIDNDARMEFSSCSRDADQYRGACSVSSGCVEVCRHHRRWKSMQYPDVPMQGYSLDELNMKVVDQISRDAIRGQDHFNYVAQSPLSGKGLSKSPSNGIKEGARILCVTYTISTRHDQVMKYCIFCERVVECSEVTQFNFAQVAAILDTWGKRCDGYVASSNHTDLSINAVKFARRGDERFGNIWQKVRATLLALDAHLLRLEEDPASHNSEVRLWCAMMGGLCCRFVFPS